LARSCLEIWQTPLAKRQATDAVQDRAWEASMSEQGGNKKSDPSREGYDWPSIALFFIFLGAFIYAFLQR
jgi:hypothetical protein